MDEDCVDACMSAWTLGGGSDAFALQMQCMVFVMLSLHCVPFLCPDIRKVLTAVCVWVAWKVTRADYLSGRTALHFAAHDGLVRCVRLLLADYVPSVSLDDSASSVADGGDSQANSGSSPNSSVGLKFNEPYVLPSVNLLSSFLYGIISN
jgi:hypothetical protein